jgi:hypothetical protein
MQKNPSLNTEDDQSIVFPIAQFLSTAWDGRWLIVITTLLTGVAALSWELLHPTYKSQGLFLFGGPIPMVQEKPKEKEHEKNKENGKENGKDKEPPAAGVAWGDYKRYSATFAADERFSEYAQEKKFSDNPEFSSLLGIFASRSGIAPLIEPVYTYSKLDAKELMAQPPKDASNNAIGLRISYVSGSPESAQQVVGFLGQYVRDSIIFSILSDDLRFKAADLKTGIIKLDNAIIGNKVQLDEYRRKAESLKRIIARNPRATADDTRQVVTITESNARYLPPRTLLMTTEVQVADANEAILTAKFQQKQNRLLLEYYDNAKQLLDGTKSGETILRGLETVKQKVFKDKNLEEDWVKEIYNMITVENQMAITAYLDRSRFIAGPTLSRQTSGRPVFKLGSGLMFGLLLSLLFVFGRKWWSENQVRM